MAEMHSEEVFVHSVPAGGAARSGDPPGTDARGMMTPLRSCTLALEVLEREQVVAYVRLPARTRSCPELSVDLHTAEYLEPPLKRVLVVDLRTTKCGVLGNAYGVEAELARTFDQLLRLDRRAPRRDVGVYVQIYEHTCDFYFFLSRDLSLVSETRFVFPVAVRRPCHAQAPIRLEMIASPTSSVSTAPLM